MKTRAKKKAEARNGKVGHRHRDTDKCTFAGGDPGSSWPTNACPVHCLVT